MNSNKIFQSRCFKISPQDLPETHEANLFINGLEDEFYSFTINENGDMYFQHGFRLGSTEGIYDIVIKISDDINLKIILLSGFCSIAKKDVIGVTDLYNFFLKKITQVYILDGGFLPLSIEEANRIREKGPILTKHEIVIMPPRLDARQITNQIFETTKYGPSSGKDKVYLMINEENGLVKIGRSIKPRYREKTLQSQEPKIVMVASWVCNPVAERKLHKLFHHKRVRGEWFSLDISDLIKIRDFMVPYDMQSKENFYANNQHKLQ